MRIALHSADPVVLQQLLHTLRHTPPGEEVLHCTPFVDGVTLRRALIVQAFDLLIVDDTRLGDDALLLLRWLRTVRNSGLRVILLSAREEASAVAVALEAGADDYVVLPFRPVELRARAYRYRPSGRLVDRTEKWGDWVFLHDRATVVHAGPPTQAIDLNPTGFQLAVALFRRMGCVVSRPELLDATHQACTPSALRLLDQQVFKLRRALSLEDKGMRLRSVYGMGYCVTLHREGHHRDGTAPQADRPSEASATMR